MRLFLLALGSAWWMGCAPNLPEPESEAAQLYTKRCSGCHRLYAPEVLKPEMWKYQVERMQGEMARRGVQPLNPIERKQILEYLQRFAGR